MTRRRPTEPPPIQMAEPRSGENSEEGWKALHAVSHAPDSYNLLITDHDMPGLSGLDLVKRLRAVHIALPVILATGKLPMAEFIQYPWLQPAAMLLKQALYHRGVVGNSERSIARD